MSMEQASAATQALPGSMGAGGVSIVIMAFNEAHTIGAFVREIAQTLQRTGRPHEIVIIDDGSTDATGAVIARLAAEMPGIRPIRHAVNQGLGGVYRTGFGAARGEWLSFFPADGQFPASIITQFLALSDDADMILGYVPAGARAWSARCLSWAERALYRLLFGPMPRFQGIFMCRRRMLDQLVLTSTGRGWAVVMELVIRAAHGGYRITSVLTNMEPRTNGASKVSNLRTVAANLRQVLALRRRLGRSWRRQGRDA